MNEKDILSLFKSEKAFLTGHFLLSSGLHSPNYMQCALVLQKPWIAEKLSRELAKKMRKVKADVVVGPALGGVVVSYELGRAMKKRSLFCERVEGKFELRRGFSLKRGERVVVVEDVITTGKSSYETIELVQSHGAQVVAVASLVDRSGGAAVFSQDFFSLLQISIKSYRPEDCPLCREGKISLVKPGSRGLKAAAVALAALFIALAPAHAADSSIDNNAQARENYRTYLKELKRLTGEYKAFTGELKQVLHEEGMLTPQGDLNLGLEEGSPAAAADPSVVETDKNMTVKLDLPGLQKNSIKVTIENDATLRVAGARKEGGESVERLVALPAPAASAKAHYEDGVLEVTLKKAQPAKKQVSVPVR